MDGQTVSVIASTLSNRDNRSRRDPRFSFPLNSNSAAASHDEVHGTFDETSQFGFRPGLPSMTPQVHLAANPADPTC
ncbi:MAG: hypothetical protein CMJ69_05025 [Planctomycetaceae bacterium]|nr:hypothetical protein [Planctomycetaceae bacterium]